MTDHSETPEDAEVDAHGLKEVAATGISAAALLAAGAGAASAATPAGQHAAAKQAAAKADPTMKGNFGAKPDYQTIKSTRQAARPAKNDPTLKIVEAAADPTVKIAKKTEAGPEYAKKTNPTTKAFRAGARVNPTATDKI
jgi:hypothetical protein